MMHRKVCRKSAQSPVGKLADAVTLEHNGLQSWLQLPVSARKSKREKIEEK
jgi:hypothetical protein